MIPCGQYQYGRLETAPAKALEDLESRNVRQTDIQYDQTAGFGFGQKQSGIPVFGAVGGMAGGLEKRNDSARQCGIVLNEQDSSHIYPHSALLRFAFADKNARISRMSKYRIALCQSPQRTHHRRRLAAPAPARLIGRPCGFTPTR